jgi:hypothetical protein
MLQRPHKQMLRARQHLDAGGVLASARARREWNDIGPCVLRYNVSHLKAGRR